MEERTCSEVLYQLGQCLRTITESLSDPTPFQGVKVEVASRDLLAILSAPEEVKVDGWLDDLIKGCRQMKVDLTDLVLVCLLPVMIGDVIPVSVRVNIFTALPKMLVFIVHFERIQKKAQLHRLGC